MKRILTLVCLTALLVCCDVGPRQSSAIHNPTNNIVRSQYRNINVTFYKYGDIEYRVFHAAETGMHVINHTKELMEMELIQKQMDEIDKRNQE